MRKAPDNASLRMARQFAGPCLYLSYGGLCGECDIS